MLLDDDIVANGEPESGPFSGRLVREEGVEHLALNLRRNTRSVVIGKSTLAGGIALHNKHYWSQPPCRVFTVFQKRRRFQRQTILRTLTRCHRSARLT
jgi:hypothetical protein